MRRFCIFHFGRSGSTILEHYLQRLGFNTGGEILTNSGNSGVPTDPVAVLSSYLSTHPRVHFFELKPINFRPASPGFLDRLRQAGEILDSEGVELVKLRRKNPVDRALSSMRANKSGVYHVTMNSPPFADTQFSVSLKSFSDPDSGLMNLKFLDYLDKIESVESEIFDTLAKKYATTLTYEDDLLTNPLQGAYKLCDALSLTITNNDISNVRPRVIRNSSVWTAIRNAEVLNNFFDNHPEYSRFRPATR